MMNLPSEITICEVGLRDGLQNEKTIVSTEDKLSLLRDLVDAGFPVIEVGSFMHPKKVPQMADTDDLFKALVNEFPGVEFRALIPNLRLSLIHIYNDGGAGIHDHAQDQEQDDQDRQDAPGSRCV